MEETTNLLIEKSQEVQDDVTDFSLELLRDKIEYLDVKADFFENQTVLINKIICKIELVNKELLKEEQELTDKLEKKAKVKKNLVNILNGLKSQQKMKMHETKENEALVRTNGFYYCPECPYKTKYDRTRLKDHINAVHRKLKPWKCSDCTKGKFLNEKRFKMFY